uniref:Uncharacterized protein n=1 Tax=Anguilla anguilla TaxID=7936 RepID=A0A0E9SJD4_ANGAN
MMMVFSPSHDGFVGHDLGMRGDVLRGELRRLVGLRSGSTPAAPFPSGTRAGAADWAGARSGASPTGAP